MYWCLLKLGLLHVVLLLSMLGVSNVSMGCMYVYAKATYCVIHVVMHTLSLIGLVTCDSHE